MSFEDSIELLEKQSIVRDDTGSFSSLCTIVSETRGCVLFTVYQVQRSTFQDWCLPTTVRMAVWPARRLVLFCMLPCVNDETDDT